MAWAPGKGVKGQEYKEFWDVEQGVTFIPHEKVELNIDLEALQEGGALDMDSLPEKMKEAHKSKDPEMDALPKDVPADAAAVTMPQQLPVSQIPQPTSAPPTQPVQVQQPPPAAVQAVPTTVSDAEQQQVAILASAVSGVAAAAAAGQLNPALIPPPATLQQQFNLPLSGMVPSQQLMIPQMPLSLGVPPPNSMVLMPHNTLGPGGQPMTVLNALAPAPGLPPGANPAHPGAMGLVDAGDRPGDDELSAALISNPALMGGFPPQMAGFPPGPFPPGARPPLHPNHHMMGGPQWPPNMPGQGPFIRPPGSPALPPFGRLLPGPIPGSAQGVFNPAIPPNRNSMLPGFSPVPIPPTPPPQQQQTPSQQSTQSSPQTSATPVSSGQDGDRKMSPTLLEQEYNRFVATKGVNNQTPARKNFPTSPTTPGGSGAPVGVGGNPNLEPLGTRAAQGDPNQRMLGPGNIRGPMGPQGMPPGPEMGFRHPRPMMGFPNPRGGSPQGGAMGMNRFPFPGGRLQRPFMRGRGGMDFRGPRPGFGGDWGRPHHMGREPFFDERDFPMGRRDWDMERDGDGMFPDRPWTGPPHGEMDDRFMGRGRMDEEFRGPRPREDEFGRQREDFGRSRDEFGGPRKRDEFGRHREDFGSRNREDFDGSRNRENDHGGQRNRDEEFGSSAGGSSTSGLRDGPDVENGRWNRGHDSYRDNFDRDGERDTDRDRSRRRDRDRDRDRESDRDRNRDSDRDRESDRDRNRDSDRDRESDRDRNRDSDRDRESDRDRNRDPDRDRESDRERNRDPDRDKESDRERNRDPDRDRESDRDRNRDSDRDKDRDRDRNRDRDSDRKRGRERRERTRWNRSSSREKESSAKTADVEPDKSSTAPAESEMVTETEQPIEVEPIAEPAIPDSVFKAPLPVTDIPAPSSRGGSSNNDEGEPVTDCTGPKVNYDVEASVSPKENSFAFPEEKHKSMETELPTFAEPMNSDTEPAYDFHAKDAFNSEPFEQAFSANPDANVEMPVKSVVSVDCEVEKSIEMETQQEENGNEATVEECP